MVTTAREFNARHVSDPSSVAPPALAVTDTFFPGPHSSASVVTLWPSRGDRGKILDSSRFFSFFSTIMVFDLVKVAESEVDVLPVNASVTEGEEDCWCWLQLCHGSTLEWTSPAKEQGRGSVLASLNAFRHTALGRCCPQCKS